MPATAAKPQLTIDPAHDSNGFTTIRPFDGSENGDTEAQPVATVYDPANAARLALCWNCHDDLIAVAKKLTSRGLLDGWSGEDWSNLIESARAAITRATTPG